MLPYLDRPSDLSVPAVPARELGAPPAHRHLDHRGVLYRSVSDAGRLAATVLLDAVARGRTPLAALRPEVEASTRDHLGATAGQVEFLPLGPDDVPGALISARLDRSGPGPVRPSAVGCIDPSSDPFAARCLEGEWHTEHGGGDPDEERTCLYPRATPLARVARLTHPVLDDGAGIDTPNPAYRSGPELVLEEPALAHLAPGARRHEIDPLTDPGVRGWLAGHARDAGASESLVEQFVLTGLEALRAAAPAPPRTGDDPAAATGGATPSSTVRAYLRHDLTAESATASGPRLVLDVETAGLPRLRAGSLPERVVQGLWLADKACPDLAVAVHPLAADRCRVRVVCATASAGRGRDQARRRYRARRVTRGAPAPG